MILSQCVQRLSLWAFWQLIADECTGEAVVLYPFIQDLWGSGWIVRFWASWLRNQAEYSAVLEGSLCVGGGNAGGWVPGGNAWGLLASLWSCGSVHRLHGDGCENRCASLRYLEISYSDDPTAEVCFILWKEGSFGQWHVLRKSRNVS